MATDAGPFYIAKSTIGGEQAGRGLFSRRDVHGGELIVSLKRPLLASLGIERQKDTCANCYVWTEGAGSGSRLYVQNDVTVQTCAGCKRFRYCSKKCQKEAWNRSHKHECKNFKKLLDQDIPQAVLACMEVLVRKKYGMIPDQQWKLLCGLEAHIDDFKKNRNSYENIQLMAMCAGQVSGTEDIFGREFIAAMYARILSNSMTLVTPTFDSLGIMIDPLLCHLNHSCDPNAHVAMDGARMQLRALKDIKQDEEILISYVDTTFPSAWRRTELARRWFFYCDCAKCRKGAVQQEDHWSIKPENLGEKYQDIADRLIKESSISLKKETIGEQRCSALEREAFRMYEEEQTELDSAKAVKLIESAVEFCTQSGLWPVYRQPLPALRDDLIVHMLTAGNYEDAWLQSAKRYRQVTPKLYPQMHHPVRVIQTLQMAMLAQFLASEGVNIRPGVDMALIAAMLINTTNVASKLSHGEDNAFSQSVQLKFAEVEEELKERFGSKDAMNAAFQRQGKLLAEMGK